MDVHLTSKSMCFALLLLTSCLLAGCSALWSRMTGPPHRYHTKVKWKAKQLSRSSEQVQVPTVLSGEEPRPSTPVGLVLARGWKAASYCDDVSDDQLRAYLSARLKELGVDGAEQCGTGHRVNWGFMASLLGQDVQGEEDMILVHETNPEDDFDGGGSWDEALHLCVMYVLRAEPAP